MIAPVDNAESRLAGRERHVVRNDWLGETLQGKRANLFSRHASFERHVDALIDQYLAVLGLAAEPCRDIAHGSNRSVSGALRKSDLAQGRVTLGNASTKAQLATSLAQCGDQRRRGRADRDGHRDRTLGRVGDRYGVVEEHHDAIAGELVERPLELADQRPERAVILAQKIQHLLRLGGLGEGGVAAKIAEHDNDFTAMTLQNLFVALRDDPFGKLWSKEALQPPNPAQLLNLLCDPRFQVAVQAGNLLVALAQFVQQPRIFHSDDGLRREVLEQCDLFLAERSHLLAIDRQDADDTVILAERHMKSTSRTAAVYQGSSRRTSGAVRLLGRQIDVLDGRPFAVQEARGRRTRAGEHGALTQELGEWFGDTMER